ncbi:MAG: gephyrin-like molybdotransferase Glp [Ilumatobacteraceae bacterium]
MTTAALTPIGEAQDFVLSQCVPNPAVQMDIAEALGCVVASDVAASEDVPPFANTAVDGYAVRAADVHRASTATPVDLTVIGETAAGNGPGPTIGAGQAVRIMTGAPLPAGADAVVMVEDTEVIGDRANFAGDQRVRISAAVSSGSAIRSAGDDVRQGDRVFTAGTEITPMVAGVLAMVNCRRPEVHRRVRVAVLSTGDELVDDGSPLRPGQIRESNRTMLLGMVEEAGARVVDYGIVRDDEDLLERTLRRATDECDAVVTSGGVSMGDYDVVKAVLTRIATMRWMQIAIKPAKPFAFGRLSRADGAMVPVFGLPGNPVSSMVSFELLARPALRKMAGHVESRWFRSLVTAIADSPLRRSEDGKVHYQRVVARFAADGRVHVDAVRAQGSHQLAASSGANALAVLADGGGVEAGQDVPVILLLS